MEPLDLLWHLMGSPKEMDFWPTSVLASYDIYGQ